MLLPAGLCYACVARDQGQWRIRVVKNQTPWVPTPVSPTGTLFQLFVSQFPPLVDGG